MADRGGGAVTEGSEGPPPHPPSGVEGADVLVRPKVSISVMRAALAAAGVPIAGLLERAEFEEIYWRLQEAAAQPAAGAAAPSDAPRTVLGNCASCGSSDRLKFCSRCQKVRYCSSDCQKANVRTGGDMDVISSLSVPS